MAVLAALQVGMNHSEASLIMALFGLVAVIASPVVGQILLRAADRSALIAATFLLSAGCVLDLVALSISAGNTAKTVYATGIITLAVASAVWGLARQSYLAERVAPQFRASALALLGGTLRAGDMLGPALGAGIVALLSFPGVFWLQILTGILALVCILVFVLPDEKVASSSEKTTPINPVSTGKLRATSDKISTTIAGVSGISLALVRINRTVLIPLWGTQIGLHASTISVAFVIGALCDLMSIYPGGKAQDLWGRSAALIPAFALMAIGFSILAIFPTVTVYFVGTALTGLGNGFSSGSLMTLGVDMSPDVRRQKFLGNWTALTGLGGVLGPALASLLTSLFGVGGGIWATVGVASGAGLWTLFLLPTAYRRLGLSTKALPL